MRRRLEGCPVCSAVLDAQFALTTDTVEVSNGVQRIILDRFASTWTEEDAIEERAPAFSLCGGAFLSFRSAEWDFSPAAAMTTEYVGK